MCLCRTLVSQKSFYLTDLSGYCAHSLVSVPSVAGGVSFSVRIFSEAFSFNTLKTDINLNCIQTFTFTLHRKKKQCPL